MRPNPLHRVRRVVRLERLERALLHIELVHVVLSEALNAQLIADCHDAFCGLDFAEDELEEGRFAGAVGADEANAAVGLDRHVHVVEQEAAILWEE